MKQYDAACYAWSFSYLIASIHPSYVFFKVCKACIGTSHSNCCHQGSIRHVHATFLFTSFYFILYPPFLTLNENDTKNARTYFCLMYPLRPVDTAGDDAESMTGKGKCTWLGFRVGLGRLPSVCGMVERGSSSQLCYLPWEGQRRGNDCQR